MVLRRLFLTALLSALAACTTPGVSSDGAQSAPRSSEIARWQTQAERVTLYRDPWGIAHIYGERDADAVFGMLYAQAEDDFNRVEMNYLTALGRMAEAQGESALMQDLRMRLFIDPVVLQQQYAASPSWLRALMDAFADGLNYYLYTHPEVEPKVLYRFEPWMALAFTEGSIGGDIERVNLESLQTFYGDGMELPQLALAEDPEPGGSNGFAIAPANTVNGRALLLINPHTSFFFRDELHVNSQEGLNAYGAVTWGQFFIYQGFNARTGWMHTSSRADAIDEYLETVRETANGFEYRYEGEWRPLRRTTLTLNYRDGSRTRARDFTVYHSHHGPIIRTEGERWVSIKLMQEPIKALTQSYMRTKATDHAEFRATMDLLTNSSNNTVYADADGTIAYYHGNFIPRRDLRFDWNQPLDGSIAATEWQGLHTVDEMITLVNPPNGWIQNTNNWPFSAAGPYSPRREDYPRYMVNNPENPRGVNAVRVLNGRTDFTLERLIEAAYDPTLTAFEPLIPRLQSAFAALPPAAAERQTLAAPVALLAGWNQQYGVESTAMTLAHFWGQTLMDTVRSEAASAGEDIYVFMSERASDGQVLGALTAAIAGLERDFGRWEVPWGEVNRYQRLTGAIDPDHDDRQPSLPVAFASSTWGSLAAFGARTFPGTVRLYGTRGNSFVAAVEFGERVRAKAITVGGVSGDPTSPHFADQALAFTRGEFRDVLFYREDVERAAQRQYRPGQ